MLNEYAWDLKKPPVVDVIRTVYLISKRDNFDKYTDLTGIRVS